MVDGVIVWDSHLPKASKHGENAEDCGPKHGIINTFDGVNLIHE